MSNKYRHQTREWLSYDDIILCTSANTMILKFKNMQLTIKLFARYSSTNNAKIVCLH